MKISTHHKGLNDDVGFTINEPDIIYCSIIFSQNKHLGNSLNWLHPNAKICVGGPGYNPAIRLPENIEKCPPDHSLYNSKYSIGRVTSGCIRKCSFCMVHQLEPDGIRYIQHPIQIWKPGTILRLLDDNILASPKAWKDVYKFCIEKNIKLHMEYFDIRLMKQETANQLRKLKHDTGLWFSYDVTGIEKQVRNGVEMLKKAGFPGSTIHFFLYLHDQSSIPDAQYRWAVLRELGVEPFLMVNKDNLTPRLKRVRRRGCRPAIWRNLTPSEVFT